MKWTDDVIVPAQKQPRGNAVQQMIAELEAQPGRWAEVATYPPERMQSARSRGSQTCKRYPQLQYAVQQIPPGRPQGMRYALYFRIPAGTDTDTEEN
jgi:hypothetical protein